MAEMIQFSLDLPVSTERVYRAWLDGYEHSQITGRPASIQARPGGAFSALGGEMQGKILSLAPYSRIVQSMRTPAFPEGAPDSQVELILEPTCLGARVKLTQTGIPAGQSQAFLDRWEKQYFRPMLAYFEDLVGDSVVDVDG